MVHAHDAGNIAQHIELAKMADGVGHCLVTGLTGAEVDVKGAFYQVLPGPCR